MILQILLKSNTPYHYHSLDSATESAKEDEQLHSIKVKEKQTIQKVRARARSKSPAPPGMQGKVWAV